MNNLNMNSAITRRHFARTLALPVGALMLGSALPAWAKKKKQKEDKPSSPAQPDSAQPKYETKVLWDFDGLLKDSPNPRSNRPHVYNGNAYLVVILPGRQVKVVKVSLDDGKVQMEPLWKSKPSYTAGNDNHRYYAVGIDALGYIHVTGDMHQQGHVPHWISKRPEDISEFHHACGEGSNKGPQGLSVTYPHFFRSPDGELYHECRASRPVWGIALSRLHVKTQTWTMLGADVTRADAGLKDKHDRRGVWGTPITIWENNGQGSNFGYTQPHMDICWDKNKRMHMVFGILNKTAPHKRDMVGKGHNTATHILYAYTDDGGKTIYRGDGSKIEWPIRAEAGPQQGDVVYKENQGPAPWLKLGVSIEIDKHNRPIVRCSSFKTGHHSLVLVNGKWIDRKDADAKPSGPVENGPAGNKDADEEEGYNPRLIHARTLKLPYQIENLDEEYLRDTGNLLYTAVPPAKQRKTRIILVLATPVQIKK